MKYQKGDKVRVRSDLEVGRKYGGDTFVEDMKPYLGKEVTIFNVVEMNVVEKAHGWTDYYDIIEDLGEHCWIDEMFEEVTQPPQPQSTCWQEDYWKYKEKEG